MKARLWVAIFCVVLGSVSMVQANGNDRVAPLTAAQEGEPEEAVVPVAGAPGRSVASANVPFERDSESTLPKTAMFTSEKLMEKLRAAFNTALERVQEIPECGALFAELNADGVEMLTTALYTPTHPFDEQSLCQSAAAFTWVGGVHTRLCRRFASLSEERAAMTLIHEALHHAGLTEEPMDPNGMTAREIDGMVSDACGRKSFRRELSARMEQ
jgi:hypothetical protein